MTPSRRQFLAGAAATALAPMAPLAAPVTVPPPNPLYPVWAVGTEEGRDWILTRAPTLKDAIAEWYSIQGSACGCDPDDDGECCGECDQPTGHRVKALDDKLETTGRNEARLIAGWMGECDRCGWDECDPSDYYVLADDELVCQECMTLVDWKTEDPERYAELVDELLTNEYGPDIRFPEYW